MSVTKCELKVKNHPKEKENWRKGSKLIPKILDISHFFDSERFEMESCNLAQRCRLLGYYYKFVN